MKSGFIRKRVQTLTLGEKLKKIRSERRISLVDISRSTGVQLIYLERIEEGRYNELPADVYVRGFLRRWAEFLGLNEGPIIRQYERERGMQKHLEGEGNDQADRFLSGAFRKLPRVTLTPQRMATISIAVAVCIGLGYLYNEYRQFVSEPSLIIDEPQQESIELQDPSLTVVGRTDKGARVFINDQEVLTDENGGFKEILQLQRGANRISIRAVNQFDKDTIRILSAQVRESQPTIDSDEIMGLPVKFRIANAPTWLLVNVDGEERVSRVMETGEIVEVMPKESCVVSTGNGENVYVTIGDELEGVLSAEKGIVQNIQLDMEEKRFTTPSSQEAE